MDLKYKNRKLEKICTNSTMARKTYGADMARKIHGAIDILKATDDVDILVQFSIAGCHKLKGDRKNQYAMHLIEPFRLIFATVENKIQLVEIVEIVDYH